MISSIWTKFSFYKEGICYQIEHLEIAVNAFGKTFGIRKWSLSVTESKIFGLSKQHLLYMT